MHLHIFKSRITEESLRWMEREGYGVNMVYLDKVKDKKEVMKMF